ncbi:MAG: hypothetical protein L3J30_12085 [Marinosulfonomonas sp.]|nr:hypothetical protein [Marinosulfonomonas sp.]
MRLYVPAIMVLALGACVPKVPDSGGGVGFGGYSSYEQQRAAREAELRGQTAPPSDAISGETVATTTPLETQTQQAATPAANTNNVSISDEQDFDAVAGRESIESDRVRLEQQRAQYVQIQPTAVPTGSGRGASVVEFALSTTNRVGEAQYRRSKVFAQSRFVKNCLKYPSPDLAQADFLKNGGPQRDRSGLDPDGDGFACSWDPQPFRNAKTSN